MGRITGSGSNTTHQMTDDKDKQSRLRDRIATCVVESQDGRPDRAIQQATDHGRLGWAIEGLNAILGGVILDILETADVQKAIDDLTYCSQQLARAAHAINKEFLANPPEEEEDALNYNVFHRTWWIENPSWPNGREPGAGKKHYLAHDVSYAIARAMCTEWNDEHDPGPLSDKAEFEEA